MLQQPQLIAAALHPQDTVYTPAWVAADMVQFFRPAGAILEPSKGDGVFLQFLPANTAWCEIAEGRDFFKHTTPADWIIGNPPFKQLDKFLLHAYSLAPNIVFLLPADKPFIALPRARLILQHDAEVLKRRTGAADPLDQSRGELIRSHRSCLSACHTLNQERIYSESAP